VYTSLATFSFIVSYYLFPPVPPVGVEKRSADVQIVSPAAFIAVKALPFSVTLLRLFYSWIDSVPELVFPLGPRAMRVSFNLLEGPHAFPSAQVRERNNRKFVLL